MDHGGKGSNQDQDVRRPALGKDEQKSLKNRENRNVRACWKATVLTHASGNAVALAWAGIRPTSARTSSSHAHSLTRWHRSPRLMVITYPPPAAAPGTPAAWAAAGSGPARSPATGAAACWVTVLKASSSSRRTVGHPLLVRPRHTGSRATRREHCWIPGYGRVGWLWFAHGAGEGRHHGDHRHTLQRSAVHDRRRLPTPGHRGIYPP